MIRGAAAGPALQRSSLLVATRPADWPSVQKFTYLGAVRHPSENNFPLFLSNFIKNFPLLLKKVLKSKDMLGDGKSHAPLST